MIAAAVAEAKFGNPASEAFLAKDVAISDGRLTRGMGSSHFGVFSKKFRPLDLGRPRAPTLIRGFADAF